MMHMVAKGMGLNGCVNDKNWESLQREGTWSIFRMCNSLLRRYLKLEGCSEDGEYIH